MKLKYGRLSTQSILTIKQVENHFVNCPRFTRQFYYKDLNKSTYLVGGYWDYSTKN